MTRLWRKKLAQLFVWLLSFVPIKPFSSEQPYIAAQPPMINGDLISSHPQPGVYHSLCCREDHINATLARANVLRLLNPTMIFISSAEIVVVAIIVVKVVYVLIIATFWCCHIGVYWTICGKYIRPVINYNKPRYFNLHHFTPYIQH